MFTDLLKNSLAPSPLAGRRLSDNGWMRVSAKADYAVRAAIELAAAGGDGPVKGERIADAQKIPLRFLENILGELKHAGLVQSQRGAEGGYWLSRPPDEINLAEIIRAVEGPLASIKNDRPEEIEYRGAAKPLGACGSRSAAASARCSRSPPSPTSSPTSCRAQVIDLVESPEAWLPH